MIDWLGEFGASLLATFLPFGLFVAAAWLGHAIQRRIDPHERMSDNAGCALMGVFTLLFFLLLAAIFGPSLHILESYSCRSADDYDLCMNPPDYN